MKKITVSAFLILSLLCLISFASPVQTPALTVTFSCTGNNGACTEFLQLASDGLGWTSESGQTRMQFVQAATLRQLRAIAKQRAREEATVSAANLAENGFNSTYPEP